MRASRLLFDRFTPCLVSLILASLLCQSVLGQVATEDSAGQADLDEATSLKLSASSMADLEKVIKLSESAMKKGLDEQGEQIAKGLLTATLFQHGSRFAQALLDPRERTQSPAMLKQFALKDLYNILEYDDALPQVHMMIARLEGVNVGQQITPENYKKGRNSADRAIELLEDDKPAQSKALVLRAGYESPESDKRMEILGRAIEADDSNTQAWRLRGKSRLVIGEMLSAQGKLDEAKSIREKAVEDFTKLLEDNPDDPDALQTVAELLGRLEDFDGAMKFANQAVEQNPSVFSLYLLRARLNHRQKKYDEAITDLNQAVDIQPGTFLAYLDRAEVHFDKGDKESAASDYSRARELKGNLAGIILQRMLIRSQNNMDKSVDEVSKFMEIDELSAKTEERDPDPEYRLQLATTYSVLKRPDKSIDVLSPYLAEDNASNDRAKQARFVGLRTRADAYLSLGKHAEAIEDYREAKKIRPTDNGVLNNLAWVLATSTNDDVRNGKQAIQLATEACVVTDYKQAHILSTLAAAHAETGDFDSAKQFSAQAVSLAEQAEPADGEMVKQLKAELDNYEKGEPTRELQNVLEEEESQDTEEESSEEEEEASTKQESDEDESESDEDSDNDE